jgi:hypothetical protein
VRVGIAVGSGLEVEMGIGADGAHADSKRKEEMTIIFVKNG